MTYHSFTNPWILLHKLQQRYLNIPDSIPTAEKNQIELRICIVLKYWIETRVFDFDNQILQELSSFVEDHVAVHNEVMASRLLNTLQNKMESYQQIFESSTLKTFAPNLVELYLENSITQSSLISDFSSTTIAEQLSLMDCDMFKKIEVFYFFFLSSKGFYQIKKFYFQYFKYLSE